MVISFEIAMRMITSNGQDDLSSCDTDPYHSDHRSDDGDPSGSPSLHSGKLTINIHPLMVVSCGFTYKFRPCLASRFIDHRVRFVYLWCVEGAAWHTIDRDANT